MPVRLAEIIVRNQICSLRISAVHHLNPFPLCHHQKYVPSSLDLSVWECFRLLLPSFTYGATKTHAVVFFDNTTSCALTCTLVFLKQGLVDLTCEVTALIDIDFPDTYLIALHGTAVWMNDNLEFVSQAVCSCDQHAEMSEPASLLCLRVYLYAPCELWKYGITSLQSPCHPLYAILLSDLCQRDKWHQNLE